MREVLAERLSEVEKNELTISSWATNTNRGNVSHSLVVNCLIDNSAAVTRNFGAPQLESLGAGLVVADQIVHAGQVQAPRDWESNQRPVQLHRVGSNGQCKKESDEEGSRKHGEL
jgi:hypothetical protein